MRNKKYDYVIMSDIHIGSKVCQYKKLKSFLKYIVTKTNNLIINGDLFDHHKIRKFSKKDFVIIKLLKQTQKKLNLILIEGNHDRPTNVWKSLGFSFSYTELKINNNILIIHGDKFDKYIKNHPYLSIVADYIYNLLQKLSKKVASKIKTFSKKFTKINDEVIKHALFVSEKEHCKNVSCGHTHWEGKLKLKNITYYNSGCWTEQPCSYIVIEKNTIKIKKW